MSNKLRIIAGEFKSRVLKSPQTYKVRPTQGKVRAAIFSHLHEDIVGAVFFDLFSGSGALGLEALSRGAFKGTFIDSYQESIRCIKENIQTLDLENKTNVIKMDVFSFLEKQILSKVDFIFADPPYHCKIEQVYLLVEKALMLLQPEGKFFLEFGTKITDLEQKALFCKKYSSTYLYCFNHRDSCMK